MLLIDENYKPIKEFGTDLQNLSFWYFNLTPKNKQDIDFYIESKCQLWKNLKTDAYELDIGGNEIIIPFNFFFVIAEIDSPLDCISPEEIVGRDFKAFTFAHDMEECSWSLEDVKVTGYHEDVDFIVPFIKSPYPVLISETRAILVSSQDCYNKLKDLDIGNIV